MRRVVAPRAARRVRCRCPTSVVMVVTYADTKKEKRPPRLKRNELERVVDRCAASVRASKKNAKIYHSAR